MDAGARVQRGLSKGPARRIFQSVARLQQASRVAASTLTKVMVDQVRAAECIMNHPMKAIELEDIEARVSELERATESSKSRR